MRCGICSGRLGWNWVVAALVAAVAGGGCATAGSSGEESASPRSKEKEQSSEAETAGEASEEERSSGAESAAEALRSYRSRLLATLGEHWEIPEHLGDEELEKAAGNVVVYVRLGADGHVVSMRFLEHSDFSAFDESISELLEGFTKEGGEELPLPENERIRKAVLEKGLRLEQWEIEKGE